MSEESLTVETVATKYCELTDKYVSLADKYLELHERYLGALKIIRANSWKENP